MSRFDSMALPVDEPARMVLQHPITSVPLKDESGQEAFIDLLSQDSEKAQAFERELTRRQLSKRVRAQLSAEEIEANQVGRLAAATVGWHLVGLDGAALDVPFDAKAAEELYASAKMAWVREQAELFRSSRANFKQSLPTS